MMATLLRRCFAVGTGIAALILTSPAQAEAPGVYYAWRDVEGDQAECIARSEQAMISQALLDISMQDNTVAGRTNDSTAVFICLNQGATTTIMVIVASDNEDAALTLREALKQAF